MHDPFDMAPAWLVPQLFFGVNWDEDERRLKPQRWPESWDGYPVMPMLLPKSHLFLRYCVVQTESGNPFTKRLMLLLGTSSGIDIPSCQAWRVTGAVTGLMALAHLLMLDPRDAAPIPVPPEYMPALELSAPDLLETLGIGHAMGDPVREGLVSLVSIGSRWDELMLLLPALLLDHDLWRGAQYHLASTSVFAFLGDDLRDTLYDGDVVPDSPYRMVDAETAVWLAHKAVESVIGNPPSDKRKLARRLKDLGVSDFPGVWVHEVPLDLATRVARFVDVRDRRTAHGRHHARRAALTYFEIMDYQYFTSSLLLHYAERVLERFGLPTSSS